MSAAQELLTSPEREALAALDRGDREEALAILMKEYGPTLYQYCCEMVGDEDLASEVHQMTFIQAYEGLNRFQRRSALRTWLYGIARHRCLDALKGRRRQRRRFEPVSEAPDQPVAAPAVEDLLAARSLARALARCLQGLAPRVKAAVLLRYQAGISYVEMARICRERPATLQARVARALPVLRRCLEEQGLSP